MRILLALTLLVAGCTSTPTPPPLRPSPDGVPVVPCADAIATDAQVSEGLEVFLDAVALPAKRVLEGHPTNDPAELFAKQGLLVRPHTTVDLILSGEDLGHATIAWGSPGPDETTHLRITGCDGPGWLAFAGGYTVDEPRCLTIIVRVDGRQETARIGISKPC